jgi:hypothetical protein
MRLPTASALKAGRLGIDLAQDDPADQDDVPAPAWAFVVEPNVPAGSFPDPAACEVAAASVGVPRPAVLLPPAAAVVVCARHETRCPGRTKEFSWRAYMAASWWLFRARGSAASVLGGPVAGLNADDPVNLVGNSVARSSESGLEMSPVGDYVFFICSRCNGKIL